MSVTIHPVPILTDNYVWVITDACTKSAIVVDPGEATPVLNFLNEKALTLTAILITHHHWDHTSGLLAVVASHPCPVYGPKNETIQGVTHPVCEGNSFQIDNFNSEIRILDIPGHTKGHVAYLYDNALFCGDTLFSAGCGRLFEGTYNELYTSLKKLAALPDSTKVYCAHEYTEKNLQFAKSIEPDNKMIALHLRQVETCLRQKIPTLPSTISLEKGINPFLRCEEETVIKQVPGDLPLDVFTTLRKMKDRF